MDADRYKIIGTCLCCNVLSMWQCITCIICDSCHMYMRAYIHPMYKAMPEMPNATTDRVFSSCNQNFVNLPFICTSTLWEVKLWLMENQLKISVTNQWNRSSSSSCLTPLSDWLSDEVDVTGLDVCVFVYQVLDSWQLSSLKSIKG